MKKEAHYLPNRFQHVWKRSFAWLDKDSAKSSINGHINKETIQNRVEKIGVF